MRRFATGIACILLTAFAGCTKPASQLSPVYLGAVHVKEAVPQPSEAATLFGSVDEQLKQMRADAERYQSQSAESTASLSAIEGRLGKQIDALVGRLDATDGKIESVEAKNTELAESVEADRAARDELVASLKGLVEQAEKAKEQRPESKPEQEPTQDKPDPVSQSTEFQPGEDYETTMDLAMNRGKSMVVFIGSKSCVPCKVAQKYLPQLRRKGYLSYVDYDRQPALVKVLGGSPSLPCLVVFEWKGEGHWTKRVHVGSVAIGDFAVTGTLMDNVPAAPAPVPEQPQPPEQSQPSDPQTRGIVPADFRYPGGHVTESPRHATLCSFAQQHAEYQARVRTQGHQGFGQRSANLSRALGPAEYKEICAESWPWQSRDSVEALWQEMFVCWRQSPGHWSVASKRHEAYGSGMAMSDRGVWYACIIAKN